jgi:dihydrolipoamide dehydrogenase
MIVIGGGYIGVEMGHFYAALGCKVTIMQRGSLLIPREDKDVSSLFTKLWKKKYNVITNASANKFYKKKGKIFVTVKIGRRTKTISAEKLLIATGVKPNTDYLDLEKTGVKVNKRGFVKVDKYMRTNVKGIYALGDIAGVYLFKHSANQEAEFVFNNLFHKKVPVDYYPMPHAIFTNPQVAGVGMTEQEAIEKKKKFVISKYPYKYTGMGEALAEHDGFVKFIVDKRSKEILGCHIIGPEASTLIHQVLIAMKANRKKALDILRKTIHIHPALNEVVQRAALGVDV